MLIKRDRLRRMIKQTDITPISCNLYFLPIETRIPFKFGQESLTRVTCARVCMTVKNTKGATAKGWGETPLNVQWVWPANLSYNERLESLKEFCLLLNKAWAAHEEFGHPMEIGHSFTERCLPEILKNFNDIHPSLEMPWLAALVCCSLFDIALHDAFGNIVNRPVYQTYTSTYMNKDLSHYLSPADDIVISFKDKYPSDFIMPKQNRLIAWHTVGGEDVISESKLNGLEPNDGYPVHLTEWIRQDRLKCLKIKLKGTDACWDYSRLIKVGNIALREKIKWLCVDFNCTVSEPAYVIKILDQLLHNHPIIYNMTLYIEQPFSYDLENNKFDVHCISDRKPLFMDESAHDWKLVKLGRSLGWTGVALKTCKTQTGALLSYCWAKAHNMLIMVQDLTNPMLAQIPHVLLAAHVNTIMGLETNSMQFYPQASIPEEEIHPGIFKRREGCLDLSTLLGSGFGYCIDQIHRNLPEPVAENSKPN